MLSPLVELAPTQHEMADFEAAFELSIPCGGCDQPAHWRSFGHKAGDCGGDGSNPPPPYYKCTDCYMAWRLVVSRWIEHAGWVGCEYCHEAFPTVEEFSDYRRF